MKQSYIKYILQLNVGELWQYDKQYESYQALMTQPNSDIHIDALINKE